MAEYIKKASPHVAEAEARRVEETVRKIIEDVRREGEEAVRRYSREFDRWDPPEFRVSQETIERAKRQLPQTLIEDMEFAQKQISNFARRQLESLQEFSVETMPGVILGQKLIPVRSVGAYVPGGRYPLIASAFMSILTPRIAGVERIVACCPPRDENGIYPATLYAIASSGADEVYCVGGVQALAAMAFGAISGLAPTDMVVGPGNAYVAEAKRQLFGYVGIDLLAGPTEILIIADETANPEIVALDLIAQAEHGPNSPAILVTLSRELGEEVQKQVERLLASTPTREIAEVAWRDYGEIVVASSPEEAVRLADEYAPEHLEVQTKDPDWYLERLRNYGTLFLGDEATVVYSDKAIGTNHILPTRRAARYTGGLWVGSFIKTVTYQRVTPEGSRVVAPRANAIAEAEGMLAHARSGQARLDRLS